METEDRTGDERPGLRVWGCEAVVAAAARSTNGMRAVRL